MKIIDKTIKHIWKHEISRDYDYGWLLKEDTLKNAMYYHLRKKLGSFFYRNNIRIFTEFTDNAFRNTGYRPDIVIAKVNFECDSKYYADSIQELLCVMELKYKNGFNPVNDIYRDYEKLKTYVNDLKIDSNIYMATIWEYEDDETLWCEKNASWAKSKLTELNASYKRGTKNMRFYIGEHN